MGCRPFPYNLVRLLCPSTCSLRHLEAETRGSIDSNKSHLSHSCLLYPSFRPCCFNAGYVIKIWYVSVYHM